MTNAIKYNRESGQVSIVCDTNQKGVINVGIHDTGFGISESKLDDLFQPFNRLGAELGSVEGTGIGLVITKQLVELMQGRYLG